MDTQMQGTLVNPDFTEVKDSVGPGTYKCRILDSKVDTWPAKGDKPATTFINWTLETFGEDLDKNNGRRLFHRTPISGKGAFQLQNFYTAAMGEACTGSFDREMLYGKEVEVTVVDGVDYKTKQPTGYTEIKAVKPLKQS